MRISRKKQGYIPHKKAVYNGITFDSKMEMDYYVYLLNEKREGRVLNIQCQPKYTLLDGFKRHGKTYRPITYTPDFLIEYSDGFKELIDVKGVGTQQGELRAKLFCHRYYTPLRWVRWKNKREGWVDVKKWYGRSIELPF